MKTAAVYIRVSTTDQTEYSPDAQLRAIRDFAARNNMIVRDSLIFRDEGISGREAGKRPAFMEMIRLAKSGQQVFDVILIHKFSRFARSREDSIVYKNMLRKQYGIDVISITEPISDGSFSIVIEALHEAMDEYYSINLSGEVIKGMKEKATRGEIQTSPPYGYTKKPGEPLQIVEAEAHYVRLIYEWYLSGESYFSIAGKLYQLGVQTRRSNNFDSRAVEYILNNPTYKGYSRWTPSKTVSKRIFDCPDTIVVKSDHEQIIDEDTFDRVTAKIRTEKTMRNKGRRPAETKKHYLSGILKCGQCGSSLSYSKSNDGFQCIKYTKGSCRPSQFIKSSKAEKALFEKLAEMSLSGSYSVPLRTDDGVGQRLKFIKKEIAALCRMADRTKHAYWAEIDTLEEYSRNKVQIQKEINCKLSEIRRLESGSKPAEQNICQKHVCSVADILKGDSSIALKNAALSSIIEKIVFTRPESTLHIYFYTETSCTACTNCTRK